MKKTTLMIVFAAMMVLTGCTPKMTSLFCARIAGKPVSSTIIFSNSMGEVVTLDLTTPWAWTISGVPSWLTVTPMSGNGSETIIITVNADNLGESALNGNIIFTAATGDELIINVQQQGDLYAAFKADDTPRWETGATVEKNENSPHIFISDFGGKILNSSKHKTGRITASDGSSYEILEFNGPAAIGKPTGAAIHKASTGSVPLYNLQIVKVVGNKLWIVFKETESSTERRVVQ
jgi:hypothetical protein